MVYSSRQLHTNFTILQFHSHTHCNKIKKLFSGLHNNFPYYIDLCVSMETEIVPLMGNLLVNLIPLL